MQFEVLNRLRLKDGFWHFRGQIIDGKAITLVKGKVAQFKTDGAIKRAILEKMKQALMAHKPPAPVIKTLSRNNIFKSKLSDSLELQKS